MQSTDTTQFPRGLRAGLTVITLALLLIILGLLFTWVYIACSYGNPRPVNWFRLELISEVIGSSLLPLAGIWLLALVTRSLASFVASRRAWLLLIPALAVLPLLMLVGAKAYRIYVNGLDHVRDCEAVIILCFIPNLESGSVNLPRSLG
ncbi:hypothetical protein [Massilia aerilata]|uniref:Uncharacterized protein n=1 Tax=Massilia aerilata TaxID=453817 RepID=A0ABW0S462_9BURK